MNRVLRIPRIAAKRMIGYRQIDLREIGLDDLRRESRLRRPRRAKLIVTQNSRIILEEAERLAP